MRVCFVCYGRVCRFVRVCGFISVLAPHISVFFCCSACCLLLLLLLLLPYHVCITPCFKLSSSQLSGSHGTTAAAQQYCVDHFYANDGIA